MSLLNCKPLLVVLGWVRIFTLVVGWVGLGWVGSWIGLDRVKQNGPTDNFGTTDRRPTVTQNLARMHAGSMSRGHLSDDVVYAEDACVVKYCELSSR